MKINWSEMLKSVWKVVLPYVLGALGGLTTGCVAEGDIVSHLFA